MKILFYYYKFIKSSIIIMKFKINNGVAIVLLGAVLMDSNVDAIQIGQAQNQAQTSHGIYELAVAKMTEKERKEE
jgi:hypothetical protein